MIRPLARVLLLLGMTLGVSGAAGAAELQRLKYNHPGLVVDAGVGLWAFPLPMDYDGDGDNDLVVSCPDKPFNGTYLFENRGEGDPKFPVFQPPRRISRGLTNVSPSYVDGRVRILSPGMEYPDFLAKGLEGGTKLPLPANIHPRRVRHNQWKYLDYDGDGALDLVVGVEDWTAYGWDDGYDEQGKWLKGPLKGWVYVARNEGTTEAPKYAEPKVVEIDGKPLETFGLPSPNFADFDGDGDLDLVGGEFLDGFTYFENIGTRTVPNYAAGRRLHVRGGDPLKMDLEMIVPVAFDWDGDGDHDLICGDEDGRVAFIENTGDLSDHTPVFEPPRYCQQHADDLKCGALATPVGVDWDGDGDTDIVSGNTAGYVEFFENLSGPGVESPKWAAPRRLEAGGKTLRIMAGPNGSIQGPAEAKWGYTTLSVTDWDGDERPDLIVNSIWGKVEWYRNAGTRKEPRLEAARPVAVAWEGETPKPAWTWWTPEPNTLVTQWRTTPVAVDWNRDGACDLVMLDHEGYLSFFERSGAGEKPLKPGRRMFVDESGKPLQLNAGVRGKSGRRKLCVVDWDGDGKLDFLMNSKNANWWRQVGEKDGAVILKDMGPLSEANIESHDVSPTIVDWNADGLPDVVMGAEDGHFYYLKNPRSQEVARENVKEKKTDKAPGDNALLKTEYIYDEAPFPSCHASTIVESNGQLAAAWFGGTDEGEKDVGIWMSRHVDGKWTAPVEVANGVQWTDPKGNVHRHPCWNPVLFQPRNGPLALFYKVGPNPRDWWGMLTTSTDGGKTWAVPRRLPEGIWGPIKNKPVELDDGTWLCPTSSEHDGWRVHFERTKDQGLTWELVPSIHDGKTLSAIQPSVLKHPEGRLQAVGRTRNKQVYSTWSEDGGRTWSEPSLLELPNPNSGTDAVTLADGRHVIVYNHTQKGRSPLNVAVSKDGKAWKAALVLESEPGEYSYPAVIQTADGLVHVTYTWNRKKIRHVVIDPAKLTTRPIVEGKWPGR